MDWSYQLLSDVERALLRRLSVFAGSFSLEAVEAVATDAEGLTAQEVLDLLGRLVDKSLVVVETARDEPRFRLLETVRQYAVERLAETGETDTTRRRHREFFLALVDAHPERDYWAMSTRWLHRVQVDRDNFGATLEGFWAAGDAEACVRLVSALGYYWIVDGRSLEGRTWIERVLGVPGLPTPARLNVIVLLGFLLIHQGESARLAVLADETRLLATTIDDPAGAALVRVMLANLVLHEGKLDDAERLLEEARQGLEENGLPIALAGCRMNLGWLALTRGDRVRAAHEFEGAAEAGRGGCDDFVVAALAALAPLVARAGDAGRAVALADEAVELARVVGLRTSLVSALTRASEVAILLGQPAVAERRLRESLTIVRDLGGRGWVIDSLESSALVRAAVGQSGSAARLFGACQGLRRAWDASTSTRSVRTEVERCQARLAQTLGREAFADEWARGLAMSAEEALADALRGLSAQTDDRGPGP